MYLGHNRTLLDSWRRETFIHEEILIECLYEEHTVFLVITVAQASPNYIYSVRDLHKKCILWLKKNIKTKSCTNAVKMKTTTKAGYNPVFLSLFISMLAFLY